MKNIIKKIKKKGFFLSILYGTLTIIYKIIKIFYCKILNKIKVKKIYIIFTSKPDFSDNSKYLYNYMIKTEKYKDYKYIWLTNENYKPNCELPNTKFIKLYSKYHKGHNLRALYYISIGKIVFFTHGSPTRELNKKDGQIVINLWHGCGYKAVEKKAKKWIEDSPFNFALVPGKIFIKTKKDFWGCEENQILNIGYPRYDMLLMANSETEEYISKLKDKNDKIIVWMPTFRKTIDECYPEEILQAKFDLPILNSEKELTELNNICKSKKTLLCIKRHPLQLKYSCENKELSNIRFVDNKYFDDKNIELYTFLKYTDGLITDYSSIAIDYLLLDKPIAFSLCDYNDYLKIRGFAFEEPKKYMPGHHIYNFEDMKKYIEDIGNDKDLYKEERHSIMNEVHNPCNNYCERIMNKIEEIMEEQNEKNTNSHTR